MNCLCDSMIGISDLNLYFETHMAGLDSEFIRFSVYFDNGVTDNSINDVRNAMSEWVESFEEQDIYAGYVVAINGGDRIIISLDYGCIDNCDISLRGILASLNKISGISEVIINEEASLIYEEEIPSDFDFCREFYGGI